jgi:hypothetical protein
MAIVNFFISGSLAPASFAQQKMPEGRNTDTLPTKQECCQSQ